MYNCISNVSGVLDSALGGSLDLGVADICRFSSLMSHYAFEANSCDPGGRALAIITTGGWWRGETDNGQGSPGMRSVSAIRGFNRNHLTQNGMHFLMLLILRFQFKDKANHKKELYKSLFVLNHFDKLRHYPLKCLVFI